MKKILLVLVPWLLVGQSFAHKKDAGEFPLTVHITAVDMQQGVSVRGGRGGSYLFHTHTARIDGDKRELVLTTDGAHYKGGHGLGLATAWLILPNSWLNIGDYRGNWNRNGSLEIQFINNRGKLAHQAFYIQSERLVPTAAPTAPTAAAEPDCGATTEEDARREAIAWASKHPEYHPTPENAQKVVGYMESHGLCPTQQNFDVAYQAVR